MSKAGEEESSLSERPGHQPARFSRAHDALFGLLENGALMIAFRIDEHISALRKLHQKYRDRPMSLADACIVRMAEIYERHARTDARFRFLSLSQTWPSSARTRSPGGGVDDRDHQSRARRLCARGWSNSLKSLAAGALSSPTTTYRNAPAAICPASVFTEQPSRAAPHALCAAHRA
jgi:hypothetical protein